MMNKNETLAELEKFYEMFHPAQEKTDEAFVWLSGIPHPFLNIAHLSSANAGRKIDELIAQTPSNLPISFWIHPGNRTPGLIEALNARGFNPIISCPLMTWPVQPLCMKKQDIRPANREIFHKIISEVYQFDKGVHYGFQTLMENTECENYLFYLDEKPVATASFFVNGPSGAIFNDATLSGRREANEELIRFLMHRSFELNLKKLIVLSSPEGEELYSKLGFKNLFNIEFYSKNST